MQAYQLTRRSVSGETYILALKHVGGIIRHFNNLALHCLSVRFVGVASPLGQCSNTGLKMRNKKCWVVAMSENPTDILKSEDICGEKHVETCNRAGMTVLYTAR